MSAVTRLAMTSVLPEPAQAMICRWVPRCLIAASWSGERFIEGLGVGLKPRRKTVPQNPWTKNWPYPQMVRGQNEPIRA